MTNAEFTKRIAAYSVNSLDQARGLFEHLEKSGLEPAESYRMLKEHLSRQGGMIVGNKTKTKPVGPGLCPTPDCAGMLTPVVSGDKSIRIVGCKSCRYSSIMQRVEA